MYGLLRYLPKDHLSYFAGLLVRTRLPRPIAQWSVRTFARKLAINVDEAAKPIGEYCSISDFFVRDLKPGCRPIEGEFVSPVDALLRGVGTIENGRLEQVKGKTYGLAAFLGHDEHASSFDGGLYFNFYLSPRDYHHIHSPVSGRIARSIHVPGKLWPVNDWSMATIPELFAVNERVVTYLDSSFGLVAVVMVGATNVGRMSVAYDSFVTNVPPRERETRVRNYDPPRPLAAGARLGTFHMGSSVVVLVRPGIIESGSIAVTAPCSVEYGQRLLKN